MKTRIITAAVAIAYAGLVFYLIDTPLLLVSISFLSAIAVNEIIGICKVKSKTIRISSTIYALIIPSLNTIDARYSEPLGFAVKDLFFLITIVYVLFMLYTLLKHFKTIKYEVLATIAFSTIIVPFSMSLLVYFSQLNYHFSAFTRGDSIFIFIYTLVVCWLFDSGAYFIGSKFGKRKMAPNISPKKSWEGFWGGLVVTEIACLLYLFIFNLILPTTMFTYLNIAIASPFLATLSTLGDLSASCIKRNFGAKDFGNFFPGHGGIMDRFDSVLFVAPVIYCWVQVTTMIQA